MSTIQRITSQYKITVFPDEIGLPNQNNPFQEVARIDNFGILHTANLRFDSNKIIIKMYIDDVEIFEIDLSELNSSAEPRDGISCALMFNNSNDVLVFNPRFPIMFSENVWFEARSNNNSSARDFEYGFIEWTKE